MPLQQTLQPLKKKEVKVLKVGIWARDQFLRTFLYSSSLLLTLQDSSSNKPVKLSLHLELPVTEGRLSVENKLLTTTMRMSWEARHRAVGFPADVKTQSADACYLNRPEYWERAPACQSFCYTVASCAKNLGESAIIHKERITFFTVCREVEDSSIWKTSWSI